MSSILDLIELIKLNVEVYHNARVCGDWSLSEHSEGATCFHMATQGCCEMTVPGHGQWHLAEGDLVIFPEELPHTMTPSSPMTGPQEHRLIAQSQHIEGTSMLCAQVHFRHQGYQAILRALPAVFIIRRTEKTPWLSGLLALIIQESLYSQTCTNAIIDRQCELLFAYALRYYAAQDEIKEGLFALLSNPQLARAIDRIHQQPEKDWQLSELASDIGMSRTRFSQSFKQASGWTPMQYLTWWRMQQAWSRLDAGEAVAIVAEKVGYQSEAAFSRAFSKCFGKSAGSVRRAGR